MTIIDELNQTSEVSHPNEFSHPKPKAKEPLSRSSEALKRRSARDEHYATASESRLADEGEGDLRLLVSLREDRDASLLDDLVA